MRYSITVSEISYSHRPNCLFFAFELIYFFLQDWHSFCVKLLIDCLLKYFCIISCLSLYNIISSYFCFLLIFVNFHIIRHNISSYNRAILTFQFLIIAKFINYSIIIQSIKFNLSLNLSLKPLFSRIFYWSQLFFLQNKKTTLVFYLISSVILIVRSFPISIY